MLHKPHITKSTYDCVRRDRLCISVQASPWLGLCAFVGGKCVDQAGISSAGTRQEDSTPSG